LCTDICRNLNISTAGSNERKDGSYGNLEGENNASCFQRTYKKDVIEDGLTARAAWSILGWISFDRGK
jgi:hypothetical protein